MILMQTETFNPATEVCQIIRQLLSIGECYSDLSVILVTTVCVSTVLTVANCILPQ